MPNGGNGAVRQRINFSKIPTVIKIPNLIEVQRRSYERFLQMNLLPSEREDVGFDDGVVRARRRVADRSRRASGV